MEEFARTLSANPYLQATSIVVALGTAVAFLWRSRGVFLSVLRGIWAAIVGRIWIPVEVTRRQTELSLGNSAYFVAVLTRHWIVVLIFGFVWALAGETITGLRKIEDPGSLGQTLIFSLVIFRNVFALLIGFRLGEMTLLSKWLMNEVEAAQNR